MRTSLIFLSLALTCCNSARAYEFRFNEGTNAACNACWTAPLAWCIQVVSLGDRIFYLRRNGNEAHGNVSGFGSVSCVFSNEVADIRIPEGEHRGCYRFENGVLKRVSGSEPDSSPSARKALQRLSCSLDARSLRRKLWVRGKTDPSGRNFWRGGKRLKLWFENPNEAGALMALVALFAFAGVLSARACCKVPCLLATALAVFVLVETGSRGGMLAFLLGVGAMILCEFKWRLPRKTLALAVPAFAGVAVVLYLLCAQTRIIGQMLALDEGNLIRLHVWTSVPRMMICAPFGWWMPTGHCYCDWFQPVMDFWPLRYLVSSHLSILVYGGCVVAFAYAFLWLSILRSTFRAAWRNGHALAFGLWLALAAAMFFSTIGLYHYELWVLPSVVLAVHVLRLIRERDLRILSVGWNALAAAVLVVGLLLAGLVSERHADDPFLVRRVAGGVKIGHGEPDAYVLDDGQVLSGGLSGEIGKALRTHAAEHPNLRAVKVVESWEDIPASVGCLVLSGVRCAEYVKRLQDGSPRITARTIVFVSPPSLKLAMMAGKRLRGQVKVVLGSLVAETMEHLNRSSPDLIIVPGAAVYIPNWPHYVGL